MRVVLALVLAFAAARCNVTLAAPQRIVSLAPHLTELLFTAGVGDRVVGTVEFSDYPEQARKITRIGDSQSVDFERLLALHPDIVLAWQSGTPKSIVERIEKLGLHVISLDAFRIEDVSALLLKIGEAVGASTVAAQAAAQYAAQIQTLRQEYAGRAPLRVFIQVDDQPLYTVNGRQMISQVVELCGGRNVFATLPSLAATVGLEAVIATDPQVILSTDDTAPDPRQQWHSWPQLSAVKAGNVYTVNAGNVARATLRLVRGAREVCDTLDQARGKLGLALSPSH